MNYVELNNLYKNNEFRKIDEDKLARKFYLLRSISKSTTLKKFCDEFKVEKDLDLILLDENISAEAIASFIKKSFIAKTDEEIKRIELELNKMQNFDWGGSAGNNLEKNIVNNVIKKTLKYEDIEKALLGPIQRSVYGYTLNSWYNHWSSIMIEEIFNSNSNILPTIDLVEKMDFFIKGIPFDLKVTYFPEELMKEKIAPYLKECFGSGSELTCYKKMAKNLKIAIPSDLENRALTICLYNLIKESVDPTAKAFIQKINSLKNNVYDHYMSKPNELIRWLYENQGEMRFDAANRFYVILVDKENPFDSWKLKRNVNLLKEGIKNKIDSFSSNLLNKVSFYWFKDGKTYDCFSELLFIYR